MRFLKHKKENEQEKPVFSPSIRIIPKAEVFPEQFSFEIDEEGSAWYDLDHAISKSGEAFLRINADREVYGVYVNSSGEKHFGTIGDEENETLADNYPIEPGEVYLFYENPETEWFYA